MMIDNARHSSLSVSSLASMQSSSATHRPHRGTITHRSPQRQRLSSEIVAPTKMSPLIGWQRRLSSASISRPDCYFTLAKQHSCALQPESPIHHLPLCCLGLIASYTPRCYRPSASAPISVSVAPYLDLILRPLYHGSLRQCLSSASAFFNRLSAHSLPDASPLVSLSQLFFGLRTSASARPTALSSPLQYLARMNQHLCALFSHMSLITTVAHSDSSRSQ